MSAKVRIAAPAELESINQRYRDIAFRLSEAVDVQIIAEVDGAPAGLGRITPIAPRIGELGGIVVLPEFRGGGIARQIIVALLATTDYDFLYCLPFGNLEGLYASFGFRRMEDGAALPAKVADKLCWCRQSYDAPVLLMGLQLGEVRPSR
ncbi:GNAT family N-acetyltransferase [Massilia eurypsychrophila]|jgi:N-acetylglutamate synthase-like GNAT family acetyltransferase|uniref:GNAT family N-acetyltransferase n=1 Tax=Massilia eurypsychrophila TaxID=1485217 RepID=A0A2G8TB90_9BURK|nr:GNAT family N-acetyltransferase [Massilia eurypsychrophila]PIL43292.1 GNAT family N-acetyltransferase [Massilia eurypsychrophila]